MTAGLPPRCRPHVVALAASYALGSTLALAPLAAQQGTETQASALLLDAERHLTGAGGAIDEATARQLLDQAIALGDPVAQLRRLTLARLARPGFELGAERESELSGAFPAVLERARAGDPAAQTVVGTAYLVGAGVASDPAYAVQWYRLTAGRHPWAAHNLGWMYQSGTGVPQDDAEALRWYALEARDGNAGSLYELGVAKVLGRGTSPQVAEGLRRLEDAATRGHSSAMAYLGQLLLFGDQGVARNVAAGRQWLTSAAEAGNLRAIYALGVACLQGDGLEQSDSEALSWFRLGAEAGDAGSANYLGWMYWRGRGTTKDLRQAVLWLQRAVLGGEEIWAPDHLRSIDAEEELDPESRAQILAWLEDHAAEGSPHAQAALSLVLFQGGFGAQADLQRSLEVARAGADSGSPRAMGQVAFAYWNGYGTDPNRRLALEWFRRAAEEGDPFSAYRLGLRYLNGDGLEKDLDHGLRWLERAADIGFWAAQLHLGRTFERGYYDVPRDLERARRWYEAAADQGVEEAIGWLKAEAALAQ